MSRIVARRAYRADEGKLDAAYRFFPGRATAPRHRLSTERRVLEDKGQLAASAEAYRGALKLSPGFGDTRRDWNVSQTL